MKNLEEKFVDFLNANGCEDPKCELGLKCSTLRIHRFVSHLILTYDGESELIQEFDLALHEYESER